MKRVGVIVLILFFALSQWGCSPPQKAEVLQTYERSEFIYGTLVQLKIFEGGSEATLDKMVERLKGLDNLLSTTIETSDVHRINADSGKAPVKVSPETYSIIEKSLKYSELSEGKFDVTVGPLVLLWGIGNEGAKVPTQGDIDRALALIDYRLIELNPKAQTVYLPKSGMAIELGAIAKGYAADEMVRILKENKATKAIVNLGGNVIVLGSKSEKSKWRVGIQNPESNRGEYLGIVAVSDKTVVTSGIYERYFEQDGKRYHHILDTHTGYPVDNDVTGISILTTVSIDADALSTAAFALGIDKGLQMINSIPGVEALFVTKERTLYPSKGFMDVFELTDPNFTWGK